MSDKDTTRLSVHSGNNDAYAAGAKFAGQPFVLSHRNVDEWKRGEFDE
jgi:hypothetical protein